MFIFANGGGGGVKKLVIFCGRHNCMIPNVKKINVLSFGPSVTVKRPSHFLVYVRSKQKINQNIFNLQEWHQNAQ